MDDSFVLVGVLCGIGLLPFYLKKAKSAANLVDAISLILSGAGFLTGIKVCYFAVLYRDTSPIKEISTQVFIGGFAIGWVAIQNGIKKFQP
jgi:hypothetical protein